MADFTMPDFSVPDLTGTDLARPTLVMPDPLLPDPPLPDLLHPELPPDVDRPDIAGPDPALPDLTTPEIPPTLIVPATSTSEYQETAAQPEPVDVPQPDDYPGNLATLALEIVRNSPDTQDLPLGLTYARTYTTQEAMTHRLRRQILLLSGLDGTLEVNDEPHPY